MQMMQEYVQVPFPAYECFGDLAIYVRRGDVAGNESAGYQYHEIGILLCTSTRRQWIHTGVSSFADALFLLE